MNKILKEFLITALILSTPAIAQAETVKPLKIKAETTVANMDMVIKDNFVKAKFASAENRFAQSNVKASYDDFNDLIQRASHDDYVFLVYGMKMAEYGFFDLSDALIAKLDDNGFTSSYVSDIKKYYYPSAMVNPKDVVYLADAYSNIMYNNMAIETTSELLNSNQASESDYKNYLIALGYYKSNNLPLALKYINNALVENDVNINYLALKAKILADSNKSAQALKVLAKIKKADFKTVDFQRKVKAIEEYVLYRTAKAEALKDYHLAYYYHLQEKSLLATKVLQSTVLHAKQYSPLVFSLLGRIYYENEEPLKAQEFASRALREDKNNYLASLTLADVSYDNRKYEDSLKYYKHAKKLTKDIEPSVGMAKTYLAMEKDKKSKKIYEKLLKKNQYDEICSRHGDSELWPVLDKVKEVYTAMEILPFVFAPLMAKGVMLFVLNDFLPLNQAYRFVAFILLYIIFVPFFEELVHLSLVAKFNSLSKRCNRARKNNSDTV